MPRIRLCFCGMHGWNGIIPMSDIQILVLMHVQLGLCYQDTTHTEYLSKGN